MPTWLGIFIWVLGLKLSYPFSTEIKFVMIKSTHHSVGWIMWETISFKHTRDTWNCFNGGCSHIQSGSRPLSPMMGWLLHHRLYNKMMLISENRYHHAHKYLNFITKWNPLKSDQSLALGTVLWMESFFQELQPWSTACSLQFWFLWHAMRIWKYSWGGSCIESLYTSMTPLPHQLFTGFLPLIFLEWLLRSLFLASLQSTQINFLCCCSSHHSYVSSDLTLYI